jgi:hypothetical protein
MKKKCSHKWKMTDIISGYFIVEKCYHCGEIATYFSDYYTNEEHHQDIHTWKVLEVSDTFRFNLKCGKCNEQIFLDEIAGFIKCSKCDNSCSVPNLICGKVNGNICILVALGYKTLNGFKEISKEKIEILAEYLTNIKKSVKNEIVIIPHEKMNKISSCQERLIKDPDDLFSVIND